MDVRRRRLAIPKKSKERGGKNFNQSSFRECIRDLFFTLSLARLRAFRNLVLVVADIYKAPIPSAASQIE